MTRDEFFSTMTYLTAAIGKPIAEGSGEEGKNARKARLDVYFDLLGELPADVFLTAAKRVASEHVWATFPSIAELRAAAAETFHGEVKWTSAGEAWKLAWKVACNYDPTRAGSVMARNQAGEWQHFESQLHRLCEGMPPLVVEAITSFGATALADSDANFARREFMRIYDDLLAREIRHAVLPESVKKSIASIGERQSCPVESRPAALQLATASIGKAPA